MDEIYLDYDPRNARASLWPAQFGGPWPTGMQPVRAMPPVVGAPARPPIVRTLAPYQTLPPMAYPPPGYSQHPPAPPIFSQPAYPQPVYPQPVIVQAPPSSLRRKLGDLTIADVAPLLAQVFVALRPMPAAPADQGSIDVNVTNQTKFLAAIAQHFHADQQLVAAGSVVGKLLG